MNPYDQPTFTSDSESVNEIELMSVPNIKTDIVNKHLSIMQGDKVIFIKLDELNKLIKLLQQYE